MSRPSKAIPATSGSDHLQRRLREVAFLLLLPVVVYLLACLLSYSPQDPGWSHAGEPEHIRNFGGGKMPEDLERGNFRQGPGGFPGGRPPRD